MTKKKLQLRISTWLMEKTNWLLLLILALATFIRLYRISDYLTFLGDEGRDMLVARQILQGDLVFLGPRASAGDFFLGPIYYYFISPFLLLFNYNPTGPAVFVALLGIATVFLVYYVGRELFGKWAGLIAAALYAVSPLVIAYSRSSWNPNPVPFFTILLMYVLYRGLVNNSWKLFLLAGILFGILMQLHYIVVFLGIIVFLFVLFGDFFQNKKFNIIGKVKQYALMAAGFVISFSPFLLFELKNGFPNFRTIFGFIVATVSRKETDESQPFIDIVGDVFIRLFGRLLLRFPPVEQLDSISPLALNLWQWGTILVALVSIFFLFKIKNKLIVLMLALWLFLGIILFGFYKKPIYDYYFGFLFPVPFLLLGNALMQIKGMIKVKIIGIAFVAVVFAGLFIFNLYGAPFRYSANRQMDQARRIAEFTLSKTDGKPFNFALLTPGNSDHAYRYFFEIHDQAPVTIENPEADPERNSVTDQLLIVCEYSECSPLGESLWEVAGFGRAEVVGEWKVPPVTIYKLVHYTGEE